VSEYFIYEENYSYSNPYRKVSLSDILKEEEFKDQQKFLETQRHSSASFFLGQQQPGSKSQESILSDDLSGNGGLSFYNSMESILSDESECKSAPLEILFEKCRLGQKNIGMFDPRFEMNSKSYGSSPNSGYFDYYMQNGMKFQDDDKCDISNYRLDSLEVGKSFKVVQAIKSPVHRAVTTSLSVPQFSTVSFIDDLPSSSDEQDIPSLNSKIVEYNTNLNKSLSKDFANQRKQSNPFYESSDLFVKKTVTSFIEPPKEKSQPLNRADIFADASPSCSVYVMKKSCSFEIEMGNGRRIVKNSKKFEQNLKRFEEGRKEQEDEHLQLKKSDYNLEMMGGIINKPPIAHRRCRSMKGRGKTKLKDRYNTVGQISSSKTSLSLSNTSEMRDFVNQDFVNRSSKIKRNDEKSFDIYVAEKGVNEDNMDSLEMDRKVDFKEASFDSLDSQLPSKCKSPKKSTPSEIDKLLNSKYITTAEYLKFRDIEKKIQTINKIVEFEEQKLEQEKIMKEKRMTPLFDGNTTTRGFVKNLTKNFDELAKNARDDLKNVKNWCMHSSTPIDIETGKMKRNYSLPDVLQICANKFRAFEFNEEDLLGPMPMDDSKTNLHDYPENDNTQFEFDTDADPDTEGVTKNLIFVIIFDILTACARLKTYCFLHDF
jgi:hypothetical protein